MSDMSDMNDTNDMDHMNDIGEIGDINGMNDMNRYFAFICWCFSSVLQQDWKWFTNLRACEVQSLFVSLSVFFVCYLQVHVSHRVRAYVCGVCV